MPKKQILEEKKEKEEQSLIDAILQDILKKEGRPVEHQDIAEEGLDDPRFKMSLRTKHQVNIWRGAKAKGRIYHRIAEKIGWEELGKLECQGILDHFREFAETKLKPIIDLLNKINKNDYFKTYSQAVTIYDYLMGNLDIFDFSNPERLRGKNVH